MSAIKERIFGAVSIMDEDAAVNVWNYILTQFSPRSWDDIEEVAPDDWDKVMLHDIATNPDCKEFLSSAEVMKELELE